MARITREEVFMRMVEDVALRGTCLRQPVGGVGAIIARDARPISSGYVGAPSGMPHCTEAGCIIDEARGGCIRTVHAEANAIAFAAKEGVAVFGATMYCTFSPCIDCSKLVINSGISAYIYSKPYRDSRGRQMLAEARVACYRLIYPADSNKPTLIVEPFSPE